jgi:hypothetical protein
MGIIKTKNHITLLTISILIFVSNSLLAQVNLNNTKVHETRTFTKNPISVIQSNYLDGNGSPSLQTFLKTNGLFPQNSKKQSTPYFSVSIIKEDVNRKNGKISIKSSAELMNLDFFVETIIKNNSVNVASPIWDGRVYEEDGNLIVGGYSSKFNERPVGKIDNKGRFESQLVGIDSKEFPILQIPNEQIIFDPFEWKLLKIDDSNGEVAKSSSSSFLPINIYEQKGKLLNNVSFEIESNSANSSLLLYGIMDGNKIEIANCELKDSKIAKSREGYQPDLIEGCSQPADGKVITVTFEGKFSSNVISKGDELYLNKDVVKISDNYIPKTKKIEIDGDFSDWRNIHGVSDQAGDHVSYLFSNPDTDLLDIKVKNDDKYLYLYSRVAGAHGRTGEKGRYYWYSYIDVDRDASTGYPPTRDDNCYFGIPIGDDSEAQFEFIGNKFVKTFFGFTGIGAEKEVLSGELTLGPSYYASKGREGEKRESYKIEYVHNSDSRSITHDYTEGTSEDIIIALSPDGSEVEVKVELAGFLKDKSGNPLVQLGQKIDIAIGVEGSSNHYGSDNWGADSSPVIYGYEIK